MLAILRLVVILACLGIVSFGGAAAAVGRRCFGPAAGAVSEEGGTPAGAIPARSAAGARSARRPGRIAGTTGQ